MTSPLAPLNVLTRLVLIEAGSCWRPKLVPVLPVQEGFWKIFCGGILTLTQLHRTRTEQNTGTSYHYLMVMSEVRGQIRGHTVSDAV